MVDANPNSNPTELRLERMSHPEVADYLTGSDLVMVPCGATEQHGDHLPVGMDAMAAIAVTREAARRSNVLVAPPIWYGWSPHHMGFPGTVTLRPETLTALAQDVATSLLHHGFRRVLFVNGHRLANIPPLAVMSTKVRAATGAVVVVADIAHLAQPEYAEALQHQGAGGIGHADGYETAHMLYLDPDLVKTDAIPAGGPAHSGFRMIDPSVASSRAAWWPSTERELTASGSGASGDPSWGSAQRGEELHEAMVRDLMGLIDQVRQAPVEFDPPAAPA